MSEKFGVNAFVEREVALLRQFAEFWEEQIKECHDNYPTTLSRGDWDEQFWSWYRAYYIPAWKEQQK